LRTLVDLAVAVAALITLELAVAAVFILVVVAEMIISHGELAVVLVLMPQ
jgi:hypothetical protein